MIIAETGRRICATRSQQMAKPGRQLITFLLFANITLWILDTFMTHNWVTQEIQLGFYGLLAWGVISRISLPLMIFYRFHSCVVLVEIWKNTYRTKESLWRWQGPTVSQVLLIFIHSDKKCKQIHWRKINKQLKNYFPWLIMVSYVLISFCKTCNAWESYFQTKWAS